MEEDKRGRMGRGRKKTWEKRREEKEGNGRGWEEREK